MNSFVHQIQHDHDFVYFGTSIIGSATDCDIVLPKKNNIAEKHVSIEFLEEGRFRVTNLNPSFPIRVDGAEVIKKNISPGVVIDIGPLRYQFYTDRMILAQPGGCISIRNLEFTLPNKRGAEQHILHSVDLDVPPNSITGILGPSGCGKTTLLKCLMGILQPTKGFIRFTASDGLPSSTPNSANDVSVGYVPQDDIVYGRLTLEENMRTAALVRLSYESRNGREKRITEVLDLLDLNDPALRSKPVNNLSGGQRKRVNVAVELLRMPQILLLDEPTAGLDPATQAGFMELLKRLGPRGSTVVCVTHAIETLQYFDRVVIMSDLKRGASKSVVFRGNPGELSNKLSAGELMNLFREGEGILPGEEFEELSDPEEVGQSVDDADINTTDHGFALPEVLATVQRCWLKLKRNPFNLLMVFALPVIMSFLIFFSQLPGEKWGGDILLVMVLLAIASLWLGMTLGIREIVSERSLCERELRAGMGKLNYLLGKIFYALLAAFGQTVLLAFSFCILSNLWSSGGFLYPFGQLEPWLYWGMFIALWGCVFCGAVAALTISAFTRSEALAVTLLPLLLIPHLLFNRSVFGEGIPDPLKGESYSFIAESTWPEYRRFHLLSLALPSRPAVTIMQDANPYPRREYSNDKFENVTQRNREVGGRRGKFVVEMFYLIVLTLLHVFVLTIVFDSYGPGKRVLLSKKRKKSNNAGGVYLSEDIRSELDDKPTL